MNTNYHAATLPPTPLPPSALKPAPLQQAALTPAPLTQVRAALAQGQSFAGALSSHAAPGWGAQTTRQSAAVMQAELFGAGQILQPLLDDPQVTDVLVNGPDEIWVDRGGGLQRATGSWSTAAELRELAVRLAAAAGRRLDDSQPIVDGTLPSGVRLHAVLPPLSAQGTLISLRTKRAVAFTLPELVGAGTLNSVAATLLPVLISGRLSGIISGATGSGKTTLLNSLLSLVSPTERVICIEETAELTPNHPHCVHLQERRANIEAVGSVPMAELVRAAMRMRPDRLVLGECRGPEVREVLSALNTGHEGGWATIHANASADVPARLVALGALAGLGEAVVAAQAAAALDVVLHLRRAPKRFLAEIGVFSRHGQELCVNLAVRFTVPVGPGDAGGVQLGPGWEQLCRRLDEAGIDRSQLLSITSTASTQSTSSCPVTLPLASTKATKTVHPFTAATVLAIPTLGASTQLTTV